MPLDLLKKTVGERAALLLRAIGDVSAHLHGGAYLVGGVVRDIYLGRPLTDVDIMLEKNAGQFVEFLFQSWSASLPDFPRPESWRNFLQYGTAKIFFSTDILPGIRVIDFSTARREVYRSAGKDPLISFPASLQEDLFRRDFTVNAMAIALSPASFGELWDPFDGKSHLEKKLLNTLHERSFEDDPARLLRGIRLATRLGFTFDKSAEFLVENASQGDFLATLPPYRKFDEFRKVLCERDADKMLVELEKRKLLRQIHPAISLTETSLQVIRETTQRAVDGIHEILVEDALLRVENWEIFLGILFSQLSLEEYGEILSSFRLSRKMTSRLVMILKAARKNKI